MKTTLAVIASIGILTAIGFGSFFLGRDTLRCHKVDLYNDYTFMCDGRLIQGHPQQPNIIKSEWVWTN